MKRGPSRRIRAPPGLLRASRRWNPFSGRDHRYVGGSSGKVSASLERRTDASDRRTASIPVAARVVAATNHPPASAVKEGKITQDLFYRLNVFHLALTPLRERGDDIPLLARYYLESFGDLYQYRRFKLSELDARWPSLSDRNHRWSAGVKSVWRISEPTGNGGSTSMKSLSYWARQKRSLARPEHRREIVRTACRAIKVKRSGELEISSCASTGARDRATFSKSHIQRRSGLSSVTAMGPYCVTAG